MSGDTGANAMEDTPVVLAGPSAGEDPAVALAQSLDKIRHQTTSNLVHQKRPATLLLAIEATLTEESETALTPVAYFAALLSTLEQIASLPADQQQVADPEGETLAAVLYLLAMVLPYTPASIIRTRTSSLLEVLAPLLATLKESAPAIKSLFAIFATLFLSLDNATLTSSLHYKQIYNTLLSFLVDGRPKVRRKAQEVVTSLLANPPAPSTKHPYANRTAEFVLESLKESLREGKKGGKRKQQAEGTPSDEATRAIALCAFIKSIGKDWPATAIAPLCSLLLSLPRLSNAFLTNASYDILETLFSKSSDSFEEGKVEETLEAVLAARPSGTGSIDERILPGWLGTVEHGFVAFARANPERCTLALLSTFKGVLQYLASPAQPVRAAATSTLNALSRYCITNEEVDYAATHAGIADDEPEHPLGPICDALLAALKNIKYQAVAMPHLLSVVASLISRLRIRIITGRNGKRTPAASLLLAEHIKLAGHLRGLESFEYRDAAELAIGAGTEVCGPEFVLDLLPLNLDLDAASPDTPGRAWLLPIFRNRISNTSLAHFTTYFVPLSERMFARYREADTKSENEQLTEQSRKRAGIEAKVYEAVVGQIWALFPGYCDLPVDMSKAFTKQFCEILSNVLYSQSHLRPPIFRGLQTLVTRNKTLIASGSTSEFLLESFGIDGEDGKKNLELLSTLAPSLLAVMFNVFSKAGKEGRGYVLDCIAAYLSVLTPKDVVGTYNKIQGLLQQGLQASEKAAKPQPGESTVPQTMLDFLVQLVPYLPDVETATSLLKLVLSEPILQNKDTAVQKKAYRILVRLCESGGSIGEKVIRSQLEEIVEELVEKNGNVSVSAKKDRITLLATIIPMLPKDKLHVMPSIIPEAVLATKEANEQSRAAAYELLVGMGEKMSGGGTIKRSLIKGMDGQDEEDVDEAMVDDAEATIEEYVTMVAAGLAGSSPHMISATITALSRLLFEYHTRIASETMSELISTLLVFLGSANREIVKSSIGFVKVAIVALAPVQIQPHLEKLVPALLDWSHEHKNHFKLNIRHIFERLIRKFGYDEIAKYTGDDDKKLLANIRKRQQRAKRKREAEEQGDKSGDEAALQPQASRNAYEDALYGSEEENDDSDGEAAPNPATSKGGRQQQQQNGQLRKNAIGRKRGQQEDGAYIRENDDEPLDLLDDKMLGRISRGNPLAEDARRARREQAQAGDSGFKTDSKSGKLMFNDDDETGKDQDEGMGDGGDATNAYLEAIQGEDGHRRDAKGRVKFNKSTKRSRALAEEDDLLEDVKDRLASLGVARGPGGGAGERPKKVPKKRTEKEQIGAEFKAKKAGGDIKRNDGPAPYAYVPLSNGKKGGRSGMSIVNKGGRKGAPARK